MPDLFYLGWSRLHRGRANALQTLRTVAAFEAIGVSTRLYLPPWKSSYRLSEELSALGLPAHLDIQPSALLHRRWGGWPFVLRYRKLLSGSVQVYTRVPQLSLVLGRLGVRHHLELHEVERFAENGDLARILDLQRAGWIDRIIPISEGAKQILLAAGASEEALHVAPSGVDLSAYAGIPAFDPARLRHPRIVHLGRESRERGLPIFEAIAKDGKYSLTLVGSQDHQGEGGLTVMPPVPPSQVPALYGESEIVLVPYQPGLKQVGSMSPLKLFEALASGRPIIASDLPTIREVVRNEHDALLVPPDEPRAWLEAVERLRADPELAARIAASARETARNYSWEARAAGIARAIGLQLEPQEPTAGPS